MNAAFEAAAPLFEAFLTQEPDSLLDKWKKIKAGLGE